jgi:predicted Zn-dependent peptidase
MMRSRFVACLLALVLETSCRPCPGGLVRKEVVLVPGGRGAAPLVAPLAPPFSLRYDRLDLDSGIPALVVPVDGDVPVTLSVWVGAGSDDEAEAEAGAAHVAARALIDPAVSPAAAAAAARVRSSGGAVVFETTRGWTRIGVRAPRERLEQAAAVLHPYLAAPAPDDPSVSRAAASVGREADLWWADRGAVARHRLGSLVMGIRDRGHYPDPGRLGELEAARVAEYIDRVWRAPRMVVGAALGEDDLAVLASLPPPAPGPAAGPDLAAPGSGPPVDVVVPAGTSDADPGDGASLVLMGRGLPPVGDELGPAAHVLATALAADTPASVCAELGRYEGVESCRGSVHLHAAATVLEIEARVSSGAEIDAAAAMAAWLDMNLGRPPGDALLAHAAACIGGGWAAGLQDPFRGPDLLARHELLALGGVPPEDYLALVIETSRDEVVRVLSRMHEHEPAFVVALPPSVEGEGGAVDAAGLAHGVAAGRRGFDEALERARDACGGGDRADHRVDGVEVVARTTPGKGAVAVTGMVAAGSLSDPPGQAGTAKLLSLLMARSLERAVDASPALDPSFIRSSAFYELDHLGITLEVPPDRMDQGVAAVRGALLFPAMDELAFEAARQHCMAEADSSPDGLGEPLLEALGELLGLDGPLDPDGSVSSLGILSRDALRGFHAAALERGAGLAVAGDTDPEEACRLASLSVHLAPPRTGEAVKLMDPTPSGAAQTEAYVAHRGSDVHVVVTLEAPGRDDPQSDQTAARVMLMDGAGGSLERELVDERALASSAAAAYVATARWGVVVVHVTAPATNLETLVEVMPEVVEQAGGGFTDEQIEDARLAIATRRREALATASTAAPLMALEALY